MPLHKGKSNKVRNENIREMIRAGHDVKQAAAAAYRQQREARNHLKPKRRNHLPR